MKLLCLTRSSRTQPRPSIHSQVGFLALLHWQMSDMTIRTPLELGGMLWEKSWECDNCQFNNVSRKCLWGEFKVCNVINWPGGTVISVYHWPLLCTLLTPVETHRPLLQNFNYLQVRDMILYIFYLMLQTHWSRWAATRPVTSSYCPIKFEQQCTLWRMILMNVVCIYFHCRHSWNVSVWHERRNIHWNH